MSQAVQQCAEGATTNGESLRDIAYTSAEPQKWVKI